MSTENNSDKLYNDSIKILSDLIGFKTISGEDNNSIINYCEKILGDAGASSFKVFDNDKKRVNLFSTLKSKKRMEKRPDNNDTKQPAMQPIQCSAASCCKLARQPTKQTPPLFGNAAYTYNGLPRPFLAMRGGAFADAQNIWLCRSDEQVTAMA